MILIDPMGVEMEAECQIKGSKCSWPANKKIIPVWQRKPKTKQINVCKNCLDEKVKTGEWTLK